jgi:phosphatidylserine/phosphatidylglycerophosphate/cardiolipin synthase-like enzyme
MAMFSMFLASPPAGTPVSSVYREKQAFGPYTIAGTSGFSAGIQVDVAESAPPQYRTVRTCCKGWLNVVGIQPGSSATDLNSPLVVALTPDPPEAQQMSDAAAALANVALAKFEPPVAFIYMGLDPSSLQTTVTPILQGLAYLSGIAASIPPGELWDHFRQGIDPIPVLGGMDLAEISAANLSGGFRSVGFATRTNWMDNPDTTTDPLNFVDPVLVYQRLVANNLIAPAEVTNSWLDVVTKDRVLFTFRDEWNAPIIDPAQSVLITDGASQQNIGLTIDRQGTFVAPSGMSNYTISLPGRKLTHLSDPVSGPSSDPLNQLIFGTAGPAHYVLGTVRPEDWFHPTDPGFSDPTKELPLYTESNTVEPLVDGFEAFSRIVKDLRRIYSTSDFFLFCNWQTLHTFPLIPGDPSSTLQQHLQNIDGAGAPTRALIWHHIAGSDNRQTHNFINSLVHGQSVLDARTHHSFTPLPELDLTTLLGLLTATRIDISGLVGLLAVTAYAVQVKHMGSHHSKVSVIRYSEGTASAAETAAYIGGMDFNPNRMDDPDHLPTHTRFHDVHCRIVGPAVRDVVKMFVDRWADHPDNQPTSRQLYVGPPAATGATYIEPFVASTSGSCMVQVTSTYGATTLSYAPNGDRTIWATLKQAISRAQKYIYIEDQYLVSPELSAELLSALSRIQHLVIVIDHNGLETLTPQFYRARYLFLQPLQSAAQSKLHVFSLANYGSTYKIHTKVVIIDDVFATIGSANMDRRGFTHDTQTNVFVLDGMVEDGARKFARNLRVQLWAEHLGWQHDDSAQARLKDVNHAMRYFNSHTTTSRLVPYSLTAGAGSSQMPLWNDYFDPDGSGPPT